MFGQEDLPEDLTALMAPNPVSGELVLKFFFMLLPKRWRAPRKIAPACAGAGIKLDL